VLRRLGLGLLVLLVLALLVLNGLAFSGALADAETRNASETVHGPIPPGTVELTVPNG
jgi:hypothetical protein